MVTIQKLTRRTMMQAFSLRSEVVLVTTTAFVEEWQTGAACLVPKPPLHSPTEPGTARNSAVFRKCTDWATRNFLFCEDCGFGFRRASWQSTQGLRLYVAQVAVRIARVFRRESVAISATLRVPKGGTSTHSGIVVPLNYVLGDWNVIVATTSIRHVDATFGNRSLEP